MRVVRLSAVEMKMCIDGFKVDEMESAYIDEKQLYRRSRTRPSQVLIRAVAEKNEQISATQTHSYTKA